MTAPTQASITKIWDEFAQGYSDTMAPSLSTLATQMFSYLSFGSKVHRQEKRTILELGCGDGLNTQRALEMLPSSVEYVATDVAENMVELTKRRLAARGLRAEVSVADAQATGMLANAFDDVVANLCLHLVENPDTMLTEMMRVTKPGGRAAATVWGRPVNSSMFSIVTDSMKEIGVEQNSKRSAFHLGDRDALRQKFIAHGFTNVMAWYTAVPFDIYDVEEYVQRTVFVPAWERTTSELGPENIQKLLTVIRRRAQESLEAGLPLQLEGLIVVGTKPL
eukprot:TRINITY_DN8142_c0_g1_i1.p1 TRINITY_DN8142_c0_g1~~TRINITY_DN8142_c0_g1_i1.p1  ORF type:complete len:279 (+),score=56.21 TRINITY_DN8142_c0_g1_i1:162-998(+)